MADRATATMDNQVCIICCIPGSEARLLRKKGFSTLLVSSKKRGDKLHEKMTNPYEHTVHDNCYKAYTLAYNISKVLESETVLKRNYQISVHCVPRRVPLNIITIV